MSSPLVSVLMITYNQEEFIRTAIDSVLMQKTNFQFELVIGEDFSTDSTRDICKEYAVNYPNIVKLLLNEKNIGMVLNFIRTLLSCKGDYIAICEGDDYWIDQFKLQKQVNFLIDNSDYGMVQTNKKVLVNGILFEDKTIEKKDGVFLFEDILISNIISIMTVLIRANILKDTVVKVGHHAHERGWKMLDFPIWLDIAMNYKIGFINDVTGVYRVLNESACHSSNLEKIYAFENSVIDIKEFYYEEYLKKNPNIRPALKNRLKENIFHCKKKLIFKYGIKAKNKWYELLTINPFFYFYLFYKKGQRLVDKYFSHE
jgi:glycosyltransferase involved in cell wall biosynthesis